MLTNNKKNTIMEYNYGDKYATWKKGKCKKVQQNANKTYLSTSKCFLGLSFYMHILKKYALIYYFPTVSIHKHTNFFQTYQ